MKKILTLVFAIFVINQGFACTTAVISGKYTEDGRPMIWKLRDSDYFENKLMYFKDGDYDYIGLINSEDIKGEQVWGGANAVGFSIMNSASFNVNMDDTSKIKDREGFFMKIALQKCKTLEDFEELLKTYTKPMGLAAHFGVIDAEGGAAFYEVNNYKFTKFDANNPAVAPNGYILRTNYSFTGKKDVGYGFIRFQTAQDIFYQAESKGKLNYKTILQDFSRCLKHSVLDKDFRKEYENVPAGEHFINSGDLITRHGSSSTILIEGVKEGEPADLTTIWTHVGFPNTCIALPVWLKGKEKLPQVLLADESGNAPLNAMSLKLKKECYPIERSSGYKYLQVSKLINAEKSGYIQQIEQKEKEVFQATKKKLNDWRNSNVSAKEISEYYEWLNEQTKKLYSKLLTQN